jgi:hypothetical protein
LIDSSTAAVSFVGQPIAKVTFDGLIIEGAGSAAIAIDSGGAASLSNSRASGLGGSAIMRCHRDFVLRDRGGNKGFGTSDQCAQHVRSDRSISHVSEK